MPPDEGLTIDASVIIDSLIVDIGELHRQLAISKAVRDHQAEALQAQARELAELKKNAGKGEGGD